MLFNGNETNVGVKRNAYAAAGADGRIKLYWYGGSNILSAVFSRDGTRLTPVTNTSFYGDFYAVTDGFVIGMEGGSYALERR